MEPPSAMPIIAGTRPIILVTTPATAIPFPPFFLDKLAPPRITPTIAHGIETYQKQQPNTNEHIPNCYLTSKTRKT